MIANLTVFPPTHYCDVHNKEYTSILRIKISTRPLYQYLQYYQGGCPETCPAITLIMARSIGALFIVLWFSLSQYGMQDHHFLEVKWELWYWHQNQNPTWLRSLAPNLRYGYHNCWIFQQQQGNRWLMHCLQQQPHKVGRAVSCPCWFR